MTSQSAGVPALPLRMVRMSSVLALSAALAAVGWWLGETALGGVSTWRTEPPTIDAVVATSAALIGALVCGWLALGVIVTAVQALGGLLHRPSMLPAALRTMVIWTVGAGLTVGAMSPAAARTDATSVEAAGRTAAIAAFTPVDVGWAPSDPDPDHTAGGTRSLPPQPAPPQEAPDARAVQAGATAGSVQVVAGDTLWGIASRHLGGQASETQIAREWQRWYAANRDTVGPDPDLIHPGQVLRPPG